MKNLQILSFALIATLFFASCSSDDDDGDSGPSISLIADSTTIYLGESVSFTVFDDSNNNVTANSTLFVNGLEITNPYSFDTLGTFEVSATYNSLTTLDISIAVLSGDYFPTNESNIWTYDVDNTSIANPDINFTDVTDFLTIESAIGNDFIVNVNNGGNPNGFMNGFMRNGTLTMGQSTLSFSGIMELPEEFGYFSNQTIMLQNFVLYDLHATDNIMIDELIGEFEENLDLNGTAVPVTVEYELKSINIEAMNSFSVNEQSYENVVHTRISLNLNIFASIDLLGGNNPTDYSIISNQDVLVIDNYFAQDIGLIKSIAIQGYQLEQQFLDVLALIPNNDFNLPETMDVENIQDLDDYQIN